MSARKGGALADAAARSSASAGTPLRAAAAKVVGEWVAGVGVAVLVVAAGGGWVGVGVEVEGEGANVRKATQLLELTLPVLLTEHEENECPGPALWDTLSV